MKDVRDRFISLALTVILAQIAMACQPIPPTDTLTSLTKTPAPPTNTPALVATPLAEISATSTAVPTMPPIGVPAAPNDSIVRAKVIAVNRTAEGDKWQLELLILESQDVPSYTNFTKARLGQTILVLTNEDMTGYSVDDVMKAHVQYRGDERGGVFYASSIAKAKR